MANIISIKHKAGKRVLLVDDDASMRLMLKSVLIKEGYSVIEAGSGFEALEEFKRSGAELVLIDVSMPGLDGHETCRRLRLMPGAATVPVVMITGRGDAENIERAYRNGATDFITKPVEPALFRNRLRYVMRSDQSARELASVNARNNALLESLPDVIMLIDRSGQMINALCPCRNQDGPDSVCPTRLSTYIPAAVMPRILALCEEARLDRSVKSLEFVRSDGDGEMYIETRISVTIEGDYLLVHRDVTELKHHEQRINFLAYNDPLTGLANRLYFCQQLHERLASDPETIGVLQINLDQFKRVNAALQYAMGDRVLIEVADRLRLIKSQFAAEGVPIGIARLGGDDFGLFLKHAAAGEVLDRVITACLAMMESPMLIDGHEIYMTVCIGATLNKDRPIEPLVLQARTESALHAAKRKGCGSVSHYKPSVVTNSSRCVDMESRLRKAVRRGDLRLHYQAQKEIITNRITGVEALLRWDDDVFGRVSPMEFIPIAEESGLILEVGEWVLHEACRQAKEWQERWETGIQVGINVSSLQFRRQNLPRMLLSMLHASGASAANLEIELTESSVMHDSDVAIRALQQLKDMGVSLAIDDFGTGYSSLSYLSRFPINTLKIDRSFVKDFPGKHHDAAIISAIIAMAESLSLRVIAEGVETQDQLERLTSQRCHAIQGYLISRPVPVAECTALLDRELVRLCA